MATKYKDAYGNKESTYDSIINKWGSIADIDTADTTAGGQVIWPVKAATQLYKFIDTPLNLTIVSTSVQDVPAVATLTATGQPGDTETVTIGTKVYTFQTVLTNVDGNVLIGASASATLDNLIAAINLGSGAGTTYAAAMTENDIAGLAVAGAGDTMIFYMEVAAAIATTSTAANLTWGGALSVIGTGAHSARVYYHDFNGYAMETDVNLTGADPVAIALSYGVFRIEVLTSGSTHSNVGQLKVMNSTDIYATVEAGEGQTQIACQRVPNDYTGLVTFHEASYGRVSPATNTASMRLKVRRVDGTTVIKADPLISNLTPIHEKVYKKGGIVVGPGEWVYWECILVSADNTPINAEFDLELTRIPNFQQGV